MELHYQLWKGQTAAARAPKSAKMVLLHGMGGTGALWRPLAVSLENHFDILSPDQRGHGRSQLSHASGGREAPTYTPLDYGQDVVDTLEAASFHPTWVLGHSMGVRTACAVAHLKREWVQGLVLVDLGFSGVAGGGLGEGLASFLTILPMHFASRAEAREFMSLNCPDPSIAQYLMAVSVPDGHGGVTFPFDKAALIQTIHSARDSSVRTWALALAEAGMPILVLRGAESLVWSHAEYESERGLFAQFPHVEFAEIAGAGHGLPFEKRREFAEKVTEFVLARS